MLGIIPSAGFGMSKLREKENSRRFSLRRSSFQFQSSACVACWVDKV